MGLPMATRVIKAGHELTTLVHKRKEPAEALAVLGARVVASPADVAQGADVVITVLPADRELKDTVSGARGLLDTWRPGQILIDMTTATALTMREVAEAVEGAKGLVLDAPVSGGTPAAANGTLTIMAGGDAALLDRCRPLLETMGTNILHVGGVGQGKVVKMVNQMLAAAHLVMIGEAFALGVRSGADPRTLYEVIKSSSGYSKMMDLRLPGFLFDGRDEPGFRLDLMKKDVNLALDSSRVLSVPLWLTSVVGQVFAAASAAGHGDRDFSAAAKFVAALAGAALDRTPDPASSQGAS
jgi:3-hydroxyisobutyrate dehydrogenase-like beta-hydroxyacid dehydrogenase